MADPSNLIILNITIIQMQEKIKEMHQIAHQSANKAYCPYSKFPVGVCIIAANGKKYSGCNVENVVNGMSLCAEGTAIVKMVQDGCQQIKQVYVLTRLTGEDISGPCGLCRQHIKQFSKNDKQLLIHIGSFDKGHQATVTLAQLFPRSFGPISLTK